jgi:adenylylsulfate kinase-like enzyme
VGADKFQEIYLSAPVEVCRTRDASGVYKLAESGELEGLSGVTSPYEQPQSPDLIVPTHELSIEESVKRIMEFLNVGA